MKKTVVLNGLVVGEVEATGDDDQDIQAVSVFLDERGLRKKVSRYQATYNAALAFANTSAYLYEHDLRHAPRKGVSVAPFVVNAAFAIELYFKALAQKHHVTLHGHKLVQLHKSLPAKALEEIQRVTPQCARDRRLNGVPDFAAYVSDLNDVYSQWRYFFEKDHAGKVEIEPTIFVMQVLHAACCLVDA
jgi:hypothetical protein